MTDSVLWEVNHRHVKISRLHEASEGSSKSLNKKRVLKCSDWLDDEFVRQYLRFHYQFEKSEGFAIDWEQFDYEFHIKSLDNPPSFMSSKKSSAEIIREETLFAIEKHNEANGTKLVFLEHIQANYQYLSGFVTWLTFWAIDMNSSTPEAKIYQSHMCRLGKRFKIVVFRLKPTDEEIDSVDVEPPAPLQYDDSEEGFLVFARAGPEDDPGVPFVFHRTANCS